MIGEPKVEITCDKCGHNEDYYLTPLARNSYDMRDLESELKRNLWLVEGESTICEACQEEAE